MTVNYYTAGIVIYLTQQMYVHCFSILLAPGVIFFSCLKNCFTLSTFCLVWLNGPPTIFSFRIAIMSQCFFLHNFHLLFLSFLFFSVENIWLILFLFFPVGQKIIFFPFSFFFGWQWWNTIPLLSSPWLDLP